jgi:hypothetical protein
MVQHWYLVPERMVQAFLTNRSREGGKACHVRKTSTANGEAVRVFVVRGPSEGSKRLP